MTSSSVIQVLFKSGAKAEIACRDAGEAQQILVEILTALSELPVISVESSTTAMLIVSGEVACVSLGEAVQAIERQAPQQIERPRPQRPRPQPFERPVLIAN